MTASTLSGSSSSRPYTPSLTYDQAPNGLPVDHQRARQEPHPFALRSQEDQYADAPASMADYFGQSEFTSPNLKAPAMGKSAAVEEGTREENMQRVEGKPSPGRRARSHGHSHLYGDKQLEGHRLPPLTAPSPGPPPNQPPPLPPLPVPGTASSLDTATQASLSGPSFRPSHSRSVTASSTTSTTSPSRRRNRTSSRELLQAALNLAQKAVEYDGANDIAGALAMYREAVGNLRSVMERVGIQLEPLSLGLGVPEPNEQEREEMLVARRRRRAGSLGRSEEEGKTLKGIHDAYVARIGLLYQMRGDASVTLGSPSSVSMTQLAPLTSGTANDQSGSTSVDHSGLTGVGNLMLNGHSDTYTEGGSMDSQHYSKTRALGGNAYQVVNQPLNASPPISPRPDSLSAHHFNTMSPSPSSSSFSHESHFPVQPVTFRESEDLSYEVVNVADLSLNDRDRRSDSSTERSRQFKNPLRLTAESTDDRSLPLKSSSPERRNSSVSRTDRRPSLKIVATEENGSTSMSSGGPWDFRNDADTPVGAGRADSDQSVQTIQLASMPPSTVPSIEAPPQNAMNVPFYILRQIRNSMTSPQGAFVTRGLFVPRAAWSQAGVKIPALDTKIRVMALLSQNLGLVRKAGAPLLPAETGRTGSVVGLQAAVSQPTQMAILKTFTAALDDFEALSVEIQKILVKKVGAGINFAKPRKSNSSAISNWSSKFSKTLDKMTTGKSLESTSTYSECLVRLCTDAQTIDDHIKLLTADPADGDRIQTPSDLRSILQSRLKRISEFFADAILRFVLQDLSLLLSKYLKQSSKWLEE